MVESMNDERETEGEDYWIVNLKAQPTPILRSSAHSDAKALQALDIIQGATQPQESAAGAQEGEGAAAPTAAISPARTHGRYQPFRKGEVANPKGRPKGSGGLKKAVQRALEAHPDQDGVGALEGELGERVVASALELGAAYRTEVDPKLLAARAKAHEALLATLAYLEPNVRKVEQTTTSQRVVLNLAGPTPTQPRTIDAGGMSESAAGPIQGGTMQRNIPPLVEPHLPPAASPALPASHPSSEPAVKEEKPHPLGP